MVVLLVIGTILIFVIADTILQTYREKKTNVLPVYKELLATSLNPIVEISPELQMDSRMIYFKNHLSAVPKAGEKLQIGIDPLLQFLIDGSSAKIVNVASGDISKAEKLATLQIDGKNINLFSPVNGTITNTTTSKEKWFVTIKPKERVWIRSGENARQWLVGEMNRLKDLITVMGAKPQTANVLADGGTLQKGSIEHLNQDQLRELEKHFLTV